MDHNSDKMVAVAHVSIGLCVQYIYYEPAFAPQTNTVSVSQAISVWLEALQK